MQSYSGAIIPRVQLLLGAKFSRCKVLGCKVFKNRVFMQLLQILLIIGMQIFIFYVYLWEVVKTIQEAHIIRRDGLSILILIIILN